MKAKQQRAFLRRMNIQLVCATLLVLAGLVMLFMGFWIAPTGEIHNSVLVAFGETSTFAGALFGIDYNYRFRRIHHEKNQ